jgi:hypothetical protein
VRQHWWSELVVLAVLQLMDHPAAVVVDKFVS